MRRVFLPVQWPASGPTLVLRRGDVSLVLYHPPHAVLQRKLHDAVPSTYHVHLLAAFADQMYNFMSLMRGKFVVPPGE